jgi:quinol-cytochrome oxidoreductase complex cytochrome b subunit
MFKQMQYFLNLIVTSIFENHIKAYPTPLSFSYFWGFGSLAGLFLALQLLSGIFLAMHYTPNINYAFFSIEHIMRDINYGWFIRYLHSNGASFFFIMVYIHMARGLYFNSYKHPTQNLWRIGVIIFILMMAIAFMGYVLPWGQMSFRGATVITNLFTAIPFIGQEIAYWLWGGYSVDNATLNRFFSLHYLLPFILIGVVFLHLILLHMPGSNNPIKLKKINDFTFFYPYFYHKDLFLFLMMLGLFIYFVCFKPNTLGHPDNYILANSLITPMHIVPEWYFLPFYAILRSIPNKIGGVFCMFSSLLILLFINNIENFFIKKLKYIQIIILPTHAISLKKFCFWLFCNSFILLGWLGAQPVEYPFIILAFICTLFYFLYFFVILPGLLYFFTRMFFFYFFK